MKYSIIIPSRPSNDTSRVVESIKANTTDFELIIIDREAGFAEKLNEGVKKAKGDYIILLHDDNEVCGGWLDELAEVGAFNVLEHTWIWGGYTDGRYCNDKSQTPDYAMFLCLSKEAADKIFPLDETFSNPWCQDVDMGLTIRKAGYEIKCLGGKIRHYHSGAPHMASNEAYLKQKWGL